MSDRKLYAHQMRGLSKVTDSYRAGHRRIGFNAPTGSGKGEVMSVMTRGSVLKGNGVLITVPFKNLVDQMTRRLWDHGVKHVGIMQADHPGTNATMPVQVGTLQTVCRRDMKAPGLVLVDEFHINYKFVAEMMQRWRDALFVGFSASPGTKGLGLIWQDLVTPTTTRELIETINPATGRSFLSPFKPYAADHPDLSDIRVVAGDYHEDQLSERMRGTKLIANAAETYLKRARGRLCLVFCVDIAHAEAMLEMYCSQGIHAEMIIGETPRIEREAIFKRLEAHQTEVIISVGCLTTGVDLPFADAMQICRPTKSEMLFKQMAGRVLRDFPDKADALILDHSDNFKRLGFPDEIEWTELDDGKPRKNGTAEKKAKEPIECVKCQFLMPVPMRACPQCGHEIKRVSRVTFSKGELREITRKKKEVVILETKQCWYSMLLGYTQRRGMKQGWAYHKFKEKFGVYPSHRIRKIATDPNGEVLDWIRSRNIAWAKSQQGLEATTSSSEIGRAA